MNFYLYKKQNPPPLAPIWLPLHVSLVLSAPCWINKDSLKSCKLSKTSSEAELLPNSPTDFQGISQKRRPGSTHKFLGHTCFCTQMNSVTVDFHISASLTNVPNGLNLLLSATLAGAHVSESASQLLSVTTWRNGACHDGSLHWGSLLFSLQFPSAFPQSSPPRWNRNVPTSKMFFYKCYFWGFLLLKASKILQIQA